jgi:hypothetical protein
MTALAVAFVRWDGIGGSGGRHPHLKFLFVCLFMCEALTFEFA